MNLPDYRGLTPLAVAQRYGQEEIERILSALGASAENLRPKVTPDGGHDNDDDFIVVLPPWKRRGKKNPAKKNE